jgi:ferric-dicitrate binding protein FerR (iron transport regulator)
LEHTNDHIDELIGKYLAGEAVSDEIAFIESWMSESESNRKYVDQFRDNFPEGCRSHRISSLRYRCGMDQTKKILKKVRRKYCYVKPTSSSRSMGLFWRIAASLILVAGVGFFVYKLNTPQSVIPEIVVAGASTVADTLPDGSDVVLNKRSQLAYSFDKKTKVHTVKLKGEAYFKIQHDSSRTFIVDIDGVLIKDIGTSFNVKAYPESNTIEVVVESGEVMFYSDTDSGLYLRANGKGVYNKTTKTFTVDQPEENVLSYKTRFFTFSNSDLESVVQSLNGVYEKEIVVSDNIRNCHITVSFNNESQDEIVAIIAETLGLTIKESEGKITLEGPGCEQ